MIKQIKINLETKDQFEVVDITSRVSDVVKELGVEHGLVTVYVPHTTAGIKLNHFEPLLIQDIMRALYRLFPQDVNYNHDLFELRHEKNLDLRSNGHAHVKGFFLEASQTIFINSGNLQLGDKQSVLFIDCDGGRERTVYINILSDVA